MKLPSLRNLKQIEAILGIAYRVALIVLLLAPLPFSVQGPSAASSFASVFTGGARWLAA